MELRLGGKSRKLLREQITGTMIELTVQERENYPTGELLSIAHECVDESVVRIWAGMFALFENLFFLVVMSCWTGYLVQKQIYLLAIPFIQMFLDYFVMRYRMDDQAELSNREITKSYQWKERFDMIASMARMITCYEGETRAIDEISGDFGAYNKAKWMDDAYAVVTGRYLRWVHMGFILLCFCYGAELHLSDPEAFPTGNFVTLMATIFKFDSVILAIMAKVDAMNVGYAYIRKIAELLNADTVHKAKKRYRDECAAAQNRLGESKFVDHTHDITAFKVGYSYQDSSAVKSGIDHTYHVGPFNFSAEQGQLICIKSSPGQFAHGKKTLLNLLAGVTLPTRGMLSIPGYLRKRYVNFEPLIWHGSLLFNLRFGCMEEDSPQHTDDEVWSVWKLLGGDPRFQYMPEFDCGADGSRLCVTDRIVCSLTRALLSDCDLLLIASTLDPLGEQAATKIMLVLRRWVAERGLSEISAHDAHLPDSVENRTKNTLIFTSKNAHLANEADAVIEVLREGGH